MKLPRRVLIVDVDYPVVRQARVYVDGERAGGSCEGGAARLVIEKGTPERELHTLRHEIFHGAEYETAEHDLDEMLGEPKARAVSEIYARRVIPAYLAALEGAGLIRILR